VTLALILWGYAIAALAFGVLAVAVAAVRRRCPRAWG
jgi:hypothetical protein